MKNRKWTGLLLSGGCLIAASEATAQDQPKAANALVRRMMEFDKDRDDTLTKEEVSDDRLHRLFDRADADRDGKVTREELTALATKEAGRMRAPEFGPPPGGPPGFGPGGPRMVPPRAGEVLPAFLRRELDLSDEQKSQLDELQKDVDTRLAKILTRGQRKTLEQSSRRGFGPPGGPGGFGPRRGPRPGGPPGRPDGPPPDEQ